AAVLYAWWIGLAITANPARELYVVVEPAPLWEFEPLDAAELDGVLAPGGVLSRAHPAYEDRPTQRELARVVAEAYNGGGIALAEAGTGTGKSSADLVPSVQRSEERR